MSKASTPKFTLAFLLVTGILSIPHLKAQNVSGHILTEEKAPISFATIQIGEHHGTISNEEGNFSISTNGFEAKDSVYISCLGFEKLGLVVEEFTSKDYILKEQVNELSEVFLTNRKLSVDSILYYVNKNLSKNYKTELVDHEVFSRKTEFIQGKDVNFEIDKSTGFSRKQLKAFNEDFNQLETALVNNKSKQYTDFVGHLKIKDANASKLEVNKAVRLLDKNNSQSLEVLADKGKDIISKHLDKDKVYTIKTGLLKISDSVSLSEGNEKMKDTVNSIGILKSNVKQPIEHHGFKNHSILNFVLETKLYKYNLEDITFLGSEMVYVISFQPRRSSADYQGTLYISNETFAVLKADYRFYKGRVGEKFNLKLLLGIKFVQQGHTGSVLYQKSTDGYYYPKYISEQTDSYFYISRPFKFIENDNRRNKVAFEFMVEGIFKERLEVLFLSQKPISSADFVETVEPKHVDYETPTKYDPSIWADYNVLEPLDEMKAFKVEN
ncbi:carboxypeptidase-like regulatory domain-containing protein [Mangrovimonas sp. TPBH4]|uniref:carboxypeptidase-like regulatory domain-containing protein n=1 Tax=Mangrovimonas sp. TPBH4 TaxID=1645914 RepID=UPI0006B5305D|nr:carboxypeptidase-like regulatory domain-containing protein [Mangrovimonas sp. TPBH4]